MPQKSSAPKDTMGVKISILCDVMIILRIHRSSTNLDESSKQQERRQLQTLSTSSRIRTMIRVCLLLLAFVVAHQSHGFSASPPAKSSSTVASSMAWTEAQPVGNILILDHLNINHEKGRHDWLKAFYFDFLQCAIDPRKIDNLKKGSDTVWANLGAQQFHLPQGKPDAQVLEGQIKLVVKDLQAFLDRYQTLVESGSLQGSQFALEAKSNEEGTSSLLVTDPWGSRFEIVEGDETYRDLRGTQTGGEMTEAYSMTDLTFYTPMNCNLPGIARFYEQVLQAPTQLVPNSDDPDRVLVSVGPKQTLTFQRDPNGRSDVRHDDLRDDQVEAPEGFTSFLSNYGPHISMYIADFGGTYQRADQMGVAYVNPRFKRRAYTMDEAIDDCMFRILDIVDPQNPEDGVILKLEHEVRSVVKRDGSKYKSCPFDEIPDECIKN